MSDGLLCVACEDKGLVPFVLTSNPKPNSEITFDDLYFALCLCRYGRSLRCDRNGKRTVTPLWQVWCAREQVQPERVHRIEDCYDAEQLAAWGLGKPEPIDHEAKLLALGKQPKR
jgi:hypothetical protein